MGLRLGAMEVNQTGTAQPPMPEVIFALLQWTLVEPGCAQVYFDALNTGFVGRVSSISIYTALPSQLQIVTACVAPIPPAMDAK